jgi:Sulfotransferase family
LGRSRLSSLGLRLRGRQSSADPEAPEELPAWERLTELEEYEALSGMRVEHRIEVSQPLVLVSQIQRSGGTLLSQLLDGHPECHAHPHELKIGYPRERNWPPLDISRPERWFEILFEQRSARLFRRGYRKSLKGRQDEVFPFLFLPRLQKAIFDACIEARQPATEREILDCYFTSYFNAWLDNHNLYTGPKKVVTGFTPRLAMETANVERFFSAYPDGTLISIVRDPHAWFYSAAGYAPEHFGEVDVAIGLWRRSTEESLRALETYGDRVVLLTYEQLVLDTESTMELVAGRIGIELSPVLLEPTFNGRPILANSSESVGRHGILTERVDAYRDSLDPETSEQIWQLAGDLYERVSLSVAR